MNTVEILSVVTLFECGIFLLRFITSYRGVLAKTAASNNQQITNLPVFSKMTHGTCIEFYFTFIAFVCCVCSRAILETHKRTLK